VNRRAVIEGGILAALLCAATAAAVAGSTACFDDIEQHYAWDDGGFHWSAMPDRCPGSPPPASPADRKWGGSVQITASGRDAVVIEENYSWAPKRNFQGPGCARFFKTVTRKTRVAKNGVLYETKQIDDEQPQQSQRPLRPDEMIYISNIHAVPKTDDPFVQMMGSDTIAGQPCQRIAPKQSLPGAGTYTMCIVAAPSKCAAAGYLQPLELKTQGPDGRLIWHGLTSLLRYGGRGQVVSADAIKAP
jgi:hypothetical protein